MFRTILLDEDQSLFYPWQFVLFIGASLILTAVMIFLLPQLLAYLVATVLLWIGIFIFGMAFKFKKLNNRRF